MATLPPAATLRRVGALATLAGSVFAAVGIGAWCTVTKQLRDEKITVPGNAPLFPGRAVQDPATAFAQALAIKQNAERGAGGRTFADIANELREVEPGSDEERELQKLRLTLSTASGLRTSLMTSVLAYGVSAFAAGLGTLFVLMGSQLRRAG